MKLNHLTCPRCGQECWVDCAYTTCDRCQAFYYASQQHPVGFPPTVKLDFGKVTFLPPSDSKSPR